MIAIPILATMRSVVVGSPAYLKDRVKPLVPHDLMEHDCIRARMANGRVYRWEFQRRGESLTLDVPGLLMLDESGLMLDAALRGTGLAFLAELAVAEHLAAGRLVQVLDEWTPSYPGLCLYYPGRRHVPAKLRALIELIRGTAPQA